MMVMDAKAFGSRSDDTRDRRGLASGSGGLGEGGG
jgi:hypothetical protein